MSSGRRIVLDEEDFKDPEPAHPATTAPATTALAAAQPESAELPPPASTGQPEGTAGALPADPVPRGMGRADPSPQAGGPWASGSVASNGPRVGGWGVAIFFFGFIGGAIGWLALKGTDPRRADHVLKWGLIITAASIVLWILFWVVLLAIAAHTTSGSAAGAAGWPLGVR